MSERPGGTEMGYREPGIGRRRAGTRLPATEPAFEPDSSTSESSRARRTGADAVWRATVDQRLAGVEDAIGDLRTRVNSVLALIGAAVVGQIALRFFGH